MPLLVYQFVSAFEILIERASHVSSPLDCPWREKPANVQQALTHSLSPYMTQFGKLIHQMSLETTFVALNICQSRVFICLLLWLCCHGKAACGNVVRLKGVMEMTVQRPATPANLGRLNSMECGVEWSEIDHAWNQVSGNGSVLEHCTNSAALSITSLGAAAHLTGTTRDLIGHPLLNRLVQRGCLACELHEGLSASPPVPCWS